MPNLVLGAVPGAEPTTGHGEFVRAELAPDAAHSRAGSRAWQAAAVLTRGKVNTHLFLQFHYSQPLDLSDADCLAIESWVPDSQSTPSELPVILHEEGGGDFIAETGRFLAAPGRERTFVTLSRFQLAGWSKDADGVLDRKRVGDIRIGWGGYFGVEHEKVQFSVALMLALAASLVVVAPAYADDITWDFENGNDHGFTLWSVSPATPAADDPTIAGDEALTGVGGPKGLSDAGSAWSIGRPDQFDGQKPAFSEGDKARADGTMEYNQSGLNHPFTLPGQQEVLLCPMMCIWVTILTMSTTASGIRFGAISP